MGRTESQDRKQARELAKKYDAETLRRMLLAKTHDDNGKQLDFYAWRPYRVTRKESRYFGASPQEEFLRSTAKTKMLGGSNRTGKTETIVHQIVSWGMGFEPATGIRYGDAVRNEIVWYVTEPDFVESLFERLVAHIPPGEAFARFGKGAQTVRFNRTNLLVRMKSFAQPKTQFESERCFAVCSDEELPEHLLTPVKARLIDRHGQLLYGVTPLAGSVYLHEMFKGFDDTPEGMACHRQMDGRRAWWMLEMRDNPYLTPEAIEEFEEEFRGDEDELAVRVHGVYRLMLGASVFGRDTLMALGNAVTDPPLWQWFNEGGEAEDAEKGVGWAVWKEPVPGYGYVISGDVAEGKDEKADNSAAHIVEVPTGEYVATYCGKLPPKDFAEHLFRAGLRYNQAMIGPEINNTAGGVVITVLEELGYPNLYQRRTYTGRFNPQLQSYGWKTDDQSKRLLVEEFQKALVDGLVHIPDGGTVNEMRTFVKHKRRIPGTHGYGAAGSKAKDDRVMSAMIAWQLLKSQRAWTDESPEAMYRNIGRLAVQRAIERHNAQFEDGWDGW